MVVPDRLSNHSIENPVLYSTTKPNNHNEMFVELPQNLILMVSGAFLIGWMLSAINSRLGSRSKAKKRDPRDDRIRSLEAELRVAQSDGDKSRSDLDKLEDELKETTVGIERRDFVITEQQTKLERANADLKDSVLKTRELRAELADRATESVHAEAKIREVETELSVAQASTDLIATGVLDYSAVPQDEDEAGDAEEADVGNAIR